MRSFWNRLRTGPLLLASQIFRGREKSNSNASLTGLSLIMQNQNQIQICQNEKKNKTLNYRLSLMKSVSTRIQQESINSISINKKPSRCLEMLINFLILHVQMWAFVLMLPLYSPEHWKNKIYLWLYDLQIPELWGLCKYWEDNCNLCKHKF